jgi:hypothetical protein
MSSDRLIAPVPLRRGSARSGLRSSAGTGAAPAPTAGRGNGSLAARRPAVPLQPEAERLPRQAEGRLDARPSDHRGWLIDDLWQAPAADQFGQVAHPAVRCPVRKI